MVTEQPTRKVVKDRIHYATVEKKNGSWTSTPVALDVASGQGREGRTYIYSDWSTAMAHAFSRVMWERRNA